MKVILSYEFTLVELTDAITFFMGYILLAIAQKSTHSQRRTMLLNLGSMEQALACPARSHSGECGTLVSVEWQRFGLR